MPYSVRTDVYEGPFDVLLRLITDQEVDLYQVRIASIVDAFLEEVAAVERLDLDTATEFLLIAAILVELKSRKLLPGRDANAAEEDLALLEERDYLLARLVECTTFAAAGSKLEQLEREHSRSFARAVGPDERFQQLAPDLLAGLSPLDLAEAAARALEPRPVPKVEADHILVDEVTIAEVVERLTGFLPGRTPITFRQLTAGARTRTEIVVHFLALLELYKQELVELDQLGTFAEITVTWTGAEEPEAGPAEASARSLYEASAR